MQGILKHLLEQLPVLASDHGLLVGLGNGDGVSQPPPALVQYQGMAQVQQVFSLRHPLGHLYPGYLIPGVHVVEMHPVRAIVIPGDGRVGDKEGGPLPRPQKLLEQVPVQEAVHQVAGHQAGAVAVAVAGTLNGIPGAQVKAQGVHHLRALGEADVGGHRNPPVLGHAFKPVQGGRKPPRRISSLTKG